MINIAICDDEMISGQEIHKTLRAYCNEKKIDCQIITCHSGKQLLELCTKKEIQLVFLDIEMPEMNGFQVAEKIGEQKNFPKGSAPTIVFLTNYSDQVREAFRVEAFRYLLKESFRDELDECMRAYQRKVLEQRQVDAVDEGEKILISSRDILYIAAKKNGSEVWCSQQNFQSDKSLNEWQQELRELPFVRAHKSYLVNLPHIQKIEKEICLTNGYKVELSRRKKAEVSQYWHQYIVDHVFDR